MRKIRQFLNSRQPDQLDIDEDELTLEEDRLEQIVEEQVNGDLESDDEFEVPDIDPLSMKRPN
ncbi:MAG: hypothetical protein SVU32_05580 [Candidatus Nanohaloarchaea archaeon]|nr:hypothetical protein [Candidatus Nanohaloarchaea archaeon]